MYAGLSQDFCSVSGRIGLSLCRPRGSLRNCQQYHRIRTDCFGLDCLSTGGGPGMRICAAVLAADGRGICVVCGGPGISVYNGTTQNIGLNYLTSDKPLWFAGPDIVQSILLTGKVPHIEKAIRVVPHDKQTELAATSLRGMVKVNANKDSFFKHVVEQRAANHANPALQYWLKILANSGSYGLFVELNPEFEAVIMVEVLIGEMFRSNR
jgi:hypothetical protein